MNINVNLEICMVEWIFSLFSSIIPLEIQLNFYEGFFAEGWIFFYKMSISMIFNLNLNNQTYIDPEDVYLGLKLGKNIENKRDDILKKWNNLINKAYRIDINIENI
jgi:hypothetical protein